MTDGSDKLTVADFFAGAGGFSEGFREKGFDVVFALDNWGPAVETHKLNHPEAKHTQKDIRDLETGEEIDEVVPDVDVIVGGPPCVNFSMSNQAGKADKTEGLNLIECYLRIIAWKMEHGDLKYWALENVPQTQKYIKDKYTWEELQLPGEGSDLEVPKKPFHIAADYGAPQKRKRMIAGNYPEMKKTHEEGEWRTVRKVFESLGDPLHPEEVETVNDPCRDLELPKDDVTDHFYDSRIAEYRWKRAKRLKEDHGYMGTMDFPEDLDRPSRTVMATRSASTREAMIFGVDEDDDGEYEDFRLPTVREIASFMAYPINYQFEASTESKKYRLVGNSVPVKLSGALAEAIAREEGMEVPETMPPLPDAEPSNDLTGKPHEFRTPRKRPYSSKYERHVPYLKIKAFRPELSNQASNFDEEQVVWEAVLHKGVGKRAHEAREDAATIDTLVSSSIDHLQQFGVADDAEQDYEAFKRAIKDELEHKLPEAALFQDIYTRRADPDEFIGPNKALEKTREILDKHLPEEKYGETYLNNSGRIVEVDDDSIPMRIAAGYWAVRFIVDHVNGLE